MNVFVHCKRVDFTDEMRLALDEAALRALDVLNAPPTTPVEVTIKGPAQPSSDLHRAEATIKLPGGVIQADATGPGPDEVVAVLHGALFRQAQLWQGRHAAKPLRHETAMLRGEHTTERMVNEGQRDRENPTRSTDHRPPGNR